MFEEEIIRRMNELEMSALKIIESIRDKENDLHKLRSNLQTLRDEAAYTEAWAKAAAVGPNAESRKFRAMETLRADTDYVLLLERIENLERQVVDRESYLDSQKRFFRLREIQLRAEANAMANAQV